MTGTAAKWAERVRDWRASGKTADDYASGFDFEPTTLRYWASRLKAEMPAVAKPAPTLARVVRRRRPAPTRRAPEAPPAEPTMEVVVGQARIVVRRGFDAELLRQIATALGSSR
jgi:hypothetical protein